ncbi:Metallo-dependent phosphatase-like protein [Cokeromyces recurvatus]|uniref:Metallo-dependent phosphatase-like protein n=1 Tax=Cokeromyces recurvatus TaxID=90255 RepID=UPI00221FF7CA|nr:Metallo-dependent phosphatase-like protein [Cokeromyces recurvatus]KAI7903808.1 Metallo-dependent phosphatase-like protein [Cokeromyces recurvatus]
MIIVNNSEKCSLNKTRFVCISDTHGKTNFEIPDGDVLIHAGDLTRRSSMEEYDRTIKWLSSLPHKIKIITGGNHDLILDKAFGYIENRTKIISLMEQNGLTYLEHEFYQIPNYEYTLFVSPYAPTHLGGAFMLDDMSKCWNNIPPVDILVTHTPPYSHCDKVIRGNRHVGCRYLKCKIDNVIKPKVSVFGHIHEAHGYEFDDANNRLFINACLCDHRYRGNQKPIIFDL